MTTITFDNGYDGPVEFTFADEEDAKIGAGYLSVFVGPWGLKASTEDALCGVLEAVAPDRFPPGGGTIHTLRSTPELIALCEELYEQESEGEYEIPAIAAWLRTRLPEVLA